MINQKKIIIINTVFIIFFALLTVQKYKEPKAEAQQCVHQTIRCRICFEFTENYPPFPASQPQTVCTNWVGPGEDDTSPPVDIYDSVYSGHNSDENMRIYRRCLNS